MAVNKVVYGDRTLIDLTQDTITAADLRLGVTAHDAKGEAIVGEYPSLTRLTPLARDITHFWIAKTASNYGGNCAYEDKTNCRITEYELEVGKMYLFRFVEPFGTRNMVSFGNTTIIGATTTQNAARLTPREGYKGDMYFLAPCNGYLHMMTDDASTDGLETECFLMNMPD